MLPKGVDPADLKRSIPGNREEQNIWAGFKSGPIFDKVIMSKEIFY